MSLKNFPCEPIVAYAGGVGIDSIAVTDAVPVSQEVACVYHEWIKAGCHAGMSYLEKYTGLRDNPDGLLPGVKSIICCAVSYNHTSAQEAGIPAIARYAHGDDYHEVVREMLEKVAAYIRENCGGETRVCVDTAPMRERYWAVRSGLAFRGRSGLVIVPGLGTYCFLGEILTTVMIEPVANTAIKHCMECGECISQCPGGAIRPDGTVDARRCLSYLTIEHRGDFPVGLSTGGRLYGCDRCQEVCPHNRDAVVAGHPEFELRPEYQKLTPEGIQNMTREEFSTIFRRSAIKRAKLEGLRRNVKYL